MKILLAAALTLIVCLSAHAADAPGARVEQITFKSGAESTRFKQSIKGYQTAQYKFDAKAGQILTVDFKPTSTSAYFNITAKGSDSALFNGSMNGNHFLGSLPADGEYTILVYLMRNAARRDQVADYALSLALASGDATDNEMPFNQTLRLQDVTFHVTTELVDGKPMLRITPSGLQIDNAPITRPISGNIVRAEVADLNRDGSPEIYTFVRSPGRGKPGQLIAYSANNKKSLSEIYLPPITDTPKAGEVYQGEDSFAVVENTLVQRFPLYDSADAGAGRTGKMRQVQYGLVAGEAGWILREKDAVTH